MAAAALVLALAGRALAGVLIVDPNGFGDHVTLQAGIDAAANGDIIVVRPISGCCDTATIAGKSLTLIADAGADEPTARLDLTITGVPAGGQVVVRGFHPSPFAPTDYGILLVQDCAGSVWIEDCDFKGVSGSFFGQSGVEIRNSSSVSLTRCDIAGTEGLDGNPNFPPSPGTVGGAGALVENGVVAFHECSITAGDGGGSTWWGGEDGGHGVELRNATALLSGCTVSGGDAGFGGGGALGGDGLQLDATSAAQLLEAAVTGGALGGDIDAPPGAVQTLTGTERSIMIPAPKREGQGGLLVLSGEPGDVVGFFWSIRGACLPVLGKGGWFLLDPTLLAGPFGLGVISSPGGVSKILFTAPSLPPALEGLTFLVQAYFQQPGGVALGGGTAFTLLDASF